MAFQIAVKDTELYPTYANNSSTMELVFCFDTVFVDGENPFTYRGVRGCLDKVSIKKMGTGMWKIQVHDIFGSDLYPFSAPHPVDLSTNKITNFSTMRIQNIQFSLSNFTSSQNQVVPSDIYPYIWYWNPDEFPTEMALADPSIRNSVVITTFKRTTGAISDPTRRMRGNVILTIVNTFDTARLIPKETSA